VVPLKHRAPEYQRSKAPEIVSRPSTSKKLCFFAGNKNEVFGGLLFVFSMKKQSRFAFKKQTSFLAFLFLSEKKIKKSEKRSEKLKIVVKKENIGQNRLAFSISQLKPLLAFHLIPIRQLVLLRLDGEYSSWSGLRT
jgi:hypothetical protein